MYIKIGNCPNCILDIGGYIEISAFEVLSVDCIFFLTL